VKLERIKIGQTTKAEVEALLGKPTDSRKSRGQTEMGYVLSQTQLREIGLAHPAIVGAPGSLAAMELFRKSRTKFEHISIVIGKDGKVADIKRMEGDFHSTGLLVEDDYPHADFTKVDQIQPGVTTEKQLEAMLVAPPFLSRSAEGETREWKMWEYKVEPFETLTVFIGRNGVVDEVKKNFKGARFFPKGVDAKKIVQIKERQSTRQEAESILGKPSTITRNTQGSFYTYYIKVGKTREEVYIEYGNSGVVTRLIRKPVPE
jgi:outer membrane protein assembly factor BamE (lipoprotein component of BamABCDE complex)